MRILQQKIKELLLLIEASTAGETTFKLVVTHPSNIWNIRNIMFSVEWILDASGSAAAGSRTDSSA